MSEKVWVGDKNLEEQTCEKLSATIGNDTFEVDYDGKSSILDMFLEKGVDVPYSCQSGSCMACLAKVTKGRVYMDDLYILSESNVQAGECLTCQSYPASKEVEVNYDDV
ncbi:MAG: 2Fe-2S iron-sulfur cluster binding domain-containing protein [Bdellovibrionales bacterium]|nr:2Fe-2S iron-sulfur cluster binding domain-containing protein [Bdellovibrionales bacterium]